MPLELAGFPHILDAILATCSDKTLSTCRLVCTLFCDHVDAIFYRHLVVPNEQPSNVRTLCRSGDWHSWQLVLSLHDTEAAKDRTLGRVSRFTKVLDCLDPCPPLRDGYAGICLDLQAPEPGHEISLATASIPVIRRGQDDPQCEPTRRYQRWPRIAIGAAKVIDFIYAAPRNSLWHDHLLCCIPDAANEWFVHLLYNRYDGPTLLGPMPAHPLELRRDCQLPRHITFFFTRSYWAESSDSGSDSDTGMQRKRHVTLQGYFESLNCLLAQLLLHPNSPATLTLVELASALRMSGEPAYPSPEEFDRAFRDTLRYMVLQMAAFDMALEFVQQSRQAPNAASDQYRASDTVARCRRALSTVETIDLLSADEYHARTDKEQLRLETVPPKKMIHWARQRAALMNRVGNDDSAW